MTIEVEEALRGVTLSQFLVCDRDDFAEHFTLRPTWSHRAILRREIQTAPCLSRLPHLSSSHRLEMVAAYNIHKIEAGICENPHFQGAVKEMFGSFYKKIAKFNQQNAERSLLESGNLWILLCIEYLIDVYTLRNGQIIVLFCDRIPLLLLEMLKIPFIFDKTRSSERAKLFEMFTTGEISVLGFAPCFQNG